LSRKLQASSRLLHAAHNQESPEAQTLKTREFHDIYTY
jgi:hypothetical protein